MTTRNTTELMQAIGTLTDALGELKVEATEFRLTGQNGDTLDASIARADVAFYASPMQRRPARMISEMATEVQA